MPIDLQTLFQSDPAAQELGLKLVGDDRAQSKASLEQMMMKMDQERQMFPHKLKEAELANETGMAQLPGIRESARGLKLRNDFDEKTLGPRIQEALSGYRGKMTKQDYDELINTGNIFTQAGQMLYDIPGVASHARAKEILKDKYLPEFDQVPAAALGGVIKYLGQNMVNLQPDFVKKQALEGLKIEGKEALADKKAERDKELAVYKATLQQKTNEMKKDAVKEPKKFEEIIVKLRTALTREQDPDARKIIEEELNSFIELKDYFDKVRAAATAAPKPDLGKLGIETNPMPQPPQFGDTQPKPQGPAQKPATLADVQKMYPGVPADKLKEAYKRKFGVDLQ